MSPKLRKLGKKLRKMPKIWRITLGVLFIIGGFLGFLPILGFWMIPIGLLILSPDFSWARRGYLSLAVHIRRMQQKNDNRKAHKLKKEQNQKQNQQNKHEESNDDN